MEIGSYLSHYGHGRFFQDGSFNHHITSTIGFNAQSEFRVSESQCTQLVRNILPFGAEKFGLKPFCLPTWLAKVALRRWQNSLRYGMTIRYCLKLNLWIGHEFNQRSTLNCFAAETKPR